jgi:hypothetical protein
LYLHLKFISRPVYPETVIPKEEREQLEINAFVSFLDKMNAIENVSLFEHNLKASCAYFHNFLSF